MEGKAQERPRVWLSACFNSECHPDEKTAPLTSYKDLSLAALILQLLSICLVQVCLCNKVARLIATAAVSRPGASVLGVDQLIQIIGLDAFVAKGPIRRDQGSMLFHRQSSIVLAAQLAIREYMVSGNNLVYRGAIGGGRGIGSIWMVSEERIMVGTFHGFESQL